MTTELNHVSDNKWICKMFSAKSVGKHNVVRRKVSSVAKHAGMNKLEEVVRQQRWHMILTGDQCVVMCNHGNLTVVC
jgi:hypothetical protein